MRVIKFRGWDKDKKQILPVCDIAIYDISFGDDGRALTTVFQTSPKGKYYHGLVDGENGVLMQFTGLLDKNGKEIYEGDIVAECYEALGKVEKDKPFIVRFGNQYFAQEFSSGTYEKAYLGYNLDLDAEYEVIGNVYENPELLT